MTDPVDFGTLRRLAWPIVVSRSAQVVVSLSDALMVAHLGKDALAAAGAGGFNTYAILILPFGICFIVASFASQLQGRGDALGARRYGFYGLVIAGFTQLACFASLPLIGPVLGLLDYEPQVRTLMATYIGFRLLTGGAAIGIEALGSYYGGIGNTRLPMRANVIAMALNIVFNWLLIGGNLGFPELGVPGAAIASASATLLAFLWILTVFLRDGEVLVKVTLRALRRREFLRLLRFGIPSGFNWFFEFFAFNFFLNVVVAGLGTAALAAMMTVITINSFAFMPAFALASAGAILVGQHIGANKKDEVPRILKMTFMAAAGWQTAVGVAYFLAPTLIFTPFARSEDAVDRAELLRVGAYMLMLSGAWQFFDATANSIAETLRAAGDTAWTLYARLVVAWCVFVPGSLYTVKVLGGREGVAVAWVVAYLGLLSGVLFLRFRSGAWRTLKLVEPEVEA